MGETPNRAGYAFAHPLPRPALYPLQQQLLRWGLGTGIIAGTVCFSPLAGFAFLGLFAAVGALWRRDEPPVLAFCIAYQWLFIVTGFFYQWVTDRYPGGSILGDLSGAVLWSLMGLLGLTVGLRSGLRLLQHRFIPIQHKLQAIAPHYNVQRLFWYVIALYTVSWFVQIIPMSIFFAAAQIIYRMLEFREVILCVLFLVIIQQQEGYLYGVVALGYTLIPLLASAMSEFKEILFLLFIVLLSAWRPWSWSLRDQLRNLHIMWATIGMVVVLVIMALIWQGAVKSLWRSALMTGRVQGSPTEKVEALIVTAQEATERFAWGEAVESLAARLSSGMGFFSNVLERVPDIVPYEKGRLILRALEHTVKPRFLFPEKPNLSSDSWLIWRYAGLLVAGAEQGTSIGLSYMAEFYIDFGISGLLITSFLYGLLVGLLYRALLIFSPSYDFYKSAVIVILLHHFVSYEGEIAKLLGGLIQSFLIFSFIFYTVRSSFFYRNLLIRNIKY